MRPALKFLLKAVPAVSWAIISPVQARSLSKYEWDRSPARSEKVKKKVGQLANFFIQARIDTYSVVAESIHSHMSTDTTLLND